MTSVSPMIFQDDLPAESIHPWLRTLRVAFVPGPTTPLLDEVAGALVDQFTRRGHQVQAAPDDATDVLLTTAQVGKPLSWREALFFQARRRFGLRHMPTVVTMLHVQPGQWADLVAHFERALAKDPLDRVDFEFPGLAPTAYHTLVEQGQRGGPILAVERMMQAQAMCLRLLVIVGEDRPQFAYHFDLVGALSRTDGASPTFYDDIVLRLATAVSAQETGAPVVLSSPIAHATWESLSTPAAMRTASLEFGRRGFFTEMVRIADLVHVPAVGSAIAEQYSEGCFGTWEPRIEGLIATTTGSARPVDKSNITDDDLAVIVGVRAGDKSVLVRHVEGKRNDPPSSEGFEMIDMDNALPMVTLGRAWSVDDPVPVIRSKLHGHRGVAAYDPRHVEYVPMAPAYFHYPVTCGTQAQAQGLKAAFAHSEALQSPGDPRQVVFTLLPTHGVFIVEKWVAGKVPFQTIWEYMDAGYLRIEPHVPQGPEVFMPQRLSV